MPTSATGAAASITLNSVLYHLAQGTDARGRPQPAVVAGEFGPGSADEQQRAQDVPRLYDDFSGGGGYSKANPLVPNGYAWCIGDTRYPKVFMPAGRLVALTLPGQPVPSQEIPYDSFAVPEGNAIILLAGATAYAIPLQGTIAGTAGHFPGGGTATKAVRRGQKTYISMSGGSPDTIWAFDHSGAGFAQSTTVRRRWLAEVYWVVGGLGAHRLVGIGPGDALYVWPADPSAPGDPMNEDDWSAPYPIGDDVSISNNLAAGPSHVYVIRSDGIFDLDSRGYAPNLTPYWKEYYDGTNGWASCVQGDYVYASNAHGMDRVRIGSGPERDRPEWCHPGFGTPNETPIFGQVRALCPYAGGLFAAVSNGRETWLCWGISRDQPGVQSGPGPLLWHMALAHLPDVEITHLKVHLFGPAPPQVPWLLLAGVDAQTSSQPRCFRLSLGKAGTPMQLLGFPERDRFGPYEWESTAQITLPTDDWQDATALKVLRRFDIQAQGLGEAMAETAIELFAAADGGPQESQGEVVANRETLIPSSGAASGYQLELRAALRGTSTQPAFLRALKARASLSVDVTEVRVYRIRLGQMTESLTRARDRRDPEVMFAQLWGLQMTGPVELRDHRGRHLQVKVEHVSQEDHQVPGSGGRRWEMVAVLTLSVLNRPGYWDVSTWTTDATWSA